MNRQSQFLMLLCVPAALGAQSLGPVAGSWGAEGRSDNGGGLLQFSSEASAWIVGFAGNYSHSNNGGIFNTRDQASATLRLGKRTYSRLADKTRPYRTFSLVVGHNNFGTLHSTSAGAAAEFGVAQFFTPHVSLAVSGELVAMGTWETTTSSVSGPSTSSSGFGLSFNGFRVIGGVYF